MTNTGGNFIMYIHIYLDTFNCVYKYVCIYIYLCVMFCCFFEQTLTDPDPQIYCSYFFRNNL